MSEAEEFTTAGASTLLEGDAELARYSAQIAAEMKRMGLPVTITKDRKVLVHGVNRHQKRRAAAVFKKARDIVAARVARAEKNRTAVAPQPDSGEAAPSVL